VKFYGIIKKDTFEEKLVLYPLHNNTIKTGSMLLYVCFINKELLFQTLLQVLSGIKNLSVS
jgi:hypothetical protein